ncbi:MAG: MoaD/ThiS family protein [Alphaproteobacteria bacterium]|nr:MoaD/ThiS family protein [Alphaproteobacteria bacterium]
MKNEHANITVFIPTQLRNYTNGATSVRAAGVTVDEALRDIDARYPGIRFRVIDEQNRIREHVRIFADGERALTTAASVKGEVHVFGALTGG